MEEFEIRELPYSQYGNIDRCKAKISTPHSNIECSGVKKGEICNILKITSRKYKAIGELIDKLKIFFDNIKDNDILLITYFDVPIKNIKKATISFRLRE